MLSRLRRRARRNGPDAGVSLTELIVTMTLMSIVGGLALVGFVSTTRTTDATTDSSIVDAGARTAVGSWSGLLQVAVTPVKGTPSARALAITPTSLTFNAQLTNRNACSDTVACTTGAPTTVTLALTDGQLVQTIGTAAVTQVPSGAAGPATTPPAVACVFTAYRANGTSLGCDPATFTGNTYNAVARIDIAFTVTPSGGGRIQSFTTSVSLPRATT